MRYYHQSRLQARSPQASNMNKSKFKVTGNNNDLITTPEKARRTNNFVKAEEYYDRAIQGAETAEYVHELALANELAAEFYFDLDRHSTAEIYLI